MQDELIIEIAELYKNLADSTRVKILWLLSEKEMCVNEITTNLNISQSAISHQLRILRQAKLVKSRKDGKNIYYSFVDKHIMDIFISAKEHVQE